MDDEFVIFGPQHHLPIVQPHLPHHVAIIQPQPLAIVVPPVLQHGGVHHAPGQPLVVPPPAGLPIVVPGAAGAGDADAGDDGDGDAGSGGSSEDGDSSTESGSSGSSGSSAGEAAGADWVVNYDEEHDDDDFHAGGGGVPALDGDEGADAAAAAAGALPEMPFAGGKSVTMETFLIAQWAADFAISSTAINDLLRRLHTDGFNISRLCRDHRTLQRTCDAAVAAYGNVFEETELTAEYDDIAEGAPRRSMPALCRHRPVVDCVLQLLADPVMQQEGVVAHAAGGVEVGHTHAVQRAPYSSDATVAEIAELAAECGVNAADVIPIWVVVAGDDSDRRGTKLTPLYVSLLNWRVQAMHLPQASRVLAMVDRPPAAKNHESAKRASALLVQQQLQLAVFNPLTALARTLVPFTGTAALGAEFVGRTVYLLIRLGMLIGDQLWLAEVLGCKCNACVVCKVRVRSEAMGDDLTSLHLMDPHFMRDAADCVDDHAAALAGDGAAAARLDAQSMHARPNAYLRFLHNCAPLYTGWARGALDLLCVDSLHVIGAGLARNAVKSVFDVVADSKQLDQYIADQPSFTQGGRTTCGYPHGIHNLGRVTCKETTDALDVILAALIACGDRVIPGQATRVRAVRLFASLRNISQLMKVRAALPAHVDALRNAVHQVRLLLPVLFPEKRWWWSIKYHDVLHLADDMEQYGSLLFTSTEWSEKKHAIECATAERVSNNKALHATVAKFVVRKEALNAARRALLPVDEVLHPKLRPPPPDSYSTAGALSHGQATFALDVVEAARRFVHDTLGECDPADLRFASQLTIYRSGLPNTIRVHPRLKGAPVLNVVAMHWEGHDDAHLSVHTTWLAVVVGIVSHPSLVDDDGTRNWHTVSVRYKLQSASGLAAYCRQDVCSARSLFTWDVDHVDVMPVTNIVRKMRPFPIPVEDAEEPDGIADPAATALVHRLSNCLFLQGVWDAGAGDVD